MPRAASRLVPALIGTAFGTAYLMAALAAPLPAFAETNPPAPATPPAATTPPAPAVPAPPAGTVVRIGLGRSQLAATVTAPGGLYVVSDGAIVLQTQPGQAVHATLEAGQVKVTGLTKGYAGIRLLPIPPTPPPAPAPTPAPPPVPANPVTYGGKTYRGEMAILISPKDKKLSVVNVVNLEEYLLGVVAREMPSDWHVEALKAQAVAARNYSLTHLGRWADEGFDMVSTTTDQDYGGIAAERASTNMAVAATAGKVLSHNGRLASTMYHSSSGGHTENNQIVYAGGVKVDYLQGVPDFDNLPGNSRYAWRFTFSTDKLVQLLQQSGYDVGSVAAVSPSGQEGSSGRWSHWSIMGSRGDRQLTGGQVRNALDLPSMPKAFAVSAGGNVAVTRTFSTVETIYVVGANGVTTQRKITGTVMTGVGGKAVQAATAVVAASGVVDRPGGVEIVGGGYGHAVGMSQWGAYGMALQGKTYEQILTHYYQGTKVESR